MFFPEIELPAIRLASRSGDCCRASGSFAKVAEGKRAVIVLTESSLEDKVPSAEALRKQTLILRRNDHLDRDACAKLY